jgi:hypothetical protein
VSWASNPEASPSVLNCIICVNVAQTPQAGNIWITSASLRFGRSSDRKTPASPRT